MSSSTSQPTPSRARQRPVSTQGASVVLYPSLDGTSHMRTIPDRVNPGAHPSRHPSGLVLIECGVGAHERVL
jgi:hypothetical protein